MDLVAPKKPQQRGFSLLEVLITILILSLGLLGLAGLTGTSLQMAKVSQFQSTALQLAVEYADRMRSNAAAAEGGSYDITSTYDQGAALATIPGCDPSCNAAGAAAKDRAEWTNNLRQRLPGGGAWVKGKNGDPSTIDIWVMWQEPKLDTLSVKGTGGMECPPDALATGVLAADAPICLYYRVRL